MRRTLIALGGLWAMAGVPLQAQQVPPADAATPADVTVTRNASIPDLDRLAPHQAVREGNRRLREDDPLSALEAYDRAKSLRPDAPEIPFVEGLAYFAQKQYDQAREAFKKAAASDNAPLADDALYSIGTTYHTEAFQNPQDPESTIEKLESAMQRYREVLASRPDHEAARDANFKAASMRRQLRQMLEQQRQQQPQDQQCDQENKDQQNQQDQQSSDTEEPQEEQSPQPQASEGDEEPQEQQEASPQEQEEQVSREQAERRLREMMQAIREREKMRRIEVQQIPVAPVDKDW